MNLIIYSFQADLSLLKFEIKTRNKKKCPVLSHNLSKMGTYYYIVQIERRKKHAEIFVWHQ